MGQVAELVGSGKEALVEPQVTGALLRVHALVYRGGMNRCHAVMKVQDRKVRDEHGRGQARS